MSSQSRYDNRVQNTQGQAISGASIAVLSQPANTTTQPGSPLISLFSAAVSNTAVAITSATWSIGNLIFTFTAPPPADVVVGSFIQSTGFAPAGYNGVWQVVGIIGNVVTVATPYTAVAIPNPGPTTLVGTVNTSALPNPLISDNLGNFFFYAPPGAYTVQIFDFYGRIVNPLILADQAVVSGGAGSGSVTSVALTMPAEFAVGGSPIVGAGTLAVSKANQNPNLVYAGPGSGGAAAPTFRALVAADFPAGVGTVTSVGLGVTVPGFMNSVITGSPVSTTGTLNAALTFNNQNANLVFAGPSSGGAGAPSFRALVTADLPLGGLPAFSALTSGTNTTAAMVIGTGASLTVSGSGTNNATTLNGATFAAPGTIGGTTPGAATFTTATVTVGFQNSDGVAAEQYLQFGRTTIGIPVPFFRPTNGNTAIAFDISPNGTPTDFSANTGVSWIDICSTDCTGLGVVNYETLRIGKFTTATQSSAVHLSAAQGGTGLVRSMILQLNGGGVGIGALPAANALLSGTGFAFNGNGAASLASALFSGTVFTGGSGTTTFPNIYLNYGAAPSSWQIAGTLLGLNAPNAFSGWFFDCHLNGGPSVFGVSASGAMATSGAAAIGGNVTIPNVSIFNWQGQSRIASAADGRINLANNANSGFTRLTFGLESSSFPAFTISGTNINTVLGSGAAGATLTAGNIAALQSCGTTSACAGTAISATAAIVFGSVPLVSGTPSVATVTGISPSFSSSATYVCTVTNATNAANNLLKVTNVSGSSFTITGPNTVSDVINYHCVGN